MESGTGRRLRLASASLYILDELDELWPDLLSDELISVGIGVDAIALEHVVGETISPRTVGDDDGRGACGLLRHPAWDSAVDGFDGRVRPRCWDEFVDLSPLN